MHSKNVIHLGVKEFWSLARDPMMLLLIVYAFTASIYSTASALPDSLHKAPIAIVDEDQSPLSQRIINAFQPPLFVSPKLVSREEMDARMDAGQAFTGSAYVQQIVQGEVQAFLQRYRADVQPPVNVEERLRFNPNLIRSR